MAKLFDLFPSPKQFEIWDEDNLLFVFHVNSAFEVETMAFITEKNAAYGHRPKLNDNITMSESNPDWRLDEKWKHIVKRLIIASEETIKKESALVMGLEKYLWGINHDSSAT